MKNCFYQGLKVAALTISSLIALTSNSLAITLKVKVKNLEPTNGFTLAQTWFAFHDGNFDLYNLGDKSSAQLGFLSREGITGLEQYQPGVFEDAIALGLNINGLPPDIQGAILAGLDLSTLPPPASTLAGAFYRSSSGQAGGTQSLAFSNIRLPGFLSQLPQIEVSRTVTINDNNILNNRFFSYAAMVFPSNDAFIANDNSTSIPIFDSAGNFLGANFTVQGSEVLDSGTEFNDESPNSVPYSPSLVGMGILEDLPVRTHPGFFPLGAGGIADFNQNGELFTAIPGYASRPLAQITITQVNPVPEPFTILGTSIALIFGAAFKRKLNQNNLK